MATRFGPRRLAGAALAVPALALLGWLVLAVTRPALAADSTIPPLVAGQHVYDNGHVLSAHSAQTAEKLAAAIEAAGSRSTPRPTTPTFRARPTW